MKKSAKLRVLLTRRSPDIEKQIHHSSLPARTLYHPSGEWVKHNGLFISGLNVIASVVLKLKYINQFGIAKLTDTSC
jgi:hypothetical protein